MPRTRIERIAPEEAGITADIALRLGHVPGTSPQFRMDLRARFDLDTARAAVGGEVEALAPLEREAA